MGALEPYRGARLDRRTSKQLDHVEREALTRRARDQARAALASARVSDIAQVTRHGVAAAGVIALEAEAASEVSPWASKAIARVAQAGINGIVGEITKLSDPW